MLGRKERVNPVSLIGLGAGKSPAGQEVWNVVGRVVQDLAETAKKTTGLTYRVKSSNVPLSADFVEQVNFAR
jgi:hypothetical protein